MPFTLKIYWLVRTFAKADRFVRQSDELRLAGGKLATDSIMKAALNDPGDSFWTGLVRFSETLLSANVLSIYTSLATESGYRENKSNF